MRWFSAGSCNWLNIYLSRSSLRQMNVEALTFQSDQTTVILSKGFDGRNQCWPTISKWQEAALTVAAVVFVNMKWICRMHQHWNVSSLCCCRFKWHSRWRYLLVMYYAQEELSGGSSTESPAKTKPLRSIRIFRIYSQLIQHSIFSATLKWLSKPHCTST